MNQLIEMLSKVASVLSQVPQTIVFTGGATISLYLDDASVPDIRPTDDIDCVVQITSLSEYYRLSELLRTLGLVENTEPGAPLCRWLYEDITIDIMPCDESVLGFSNSWYAPGIKNAIFHQLTTEQQILIFSSPYLLASKIEAFISRGNNNFYSSPDVEDIIALLDGCSYLEQEVQQSSEELKTFLFSWFCKEFEILTEIAPAFLSSTSRNSGRARNILQIISRFAQS